MIAAVPLGGASQESAAIVDRGGVPPPQRRSRCQMMRRERGVKSLTGASIQGIEAVNQRVSRPCRLGGEGCVALDDLSPAR